MKTILAVLLVSAACTLAAADLYMAGDSTMMTYRGKDAPQQGWGQRMQELVKDGVTVKNRSIGGRSTKNFKAERRWENLIREIKKGDFVIIQFGHNDGTRDKPERYTDPTQDGCGDTILRSNYLTVYPQPISDFLSNPERTNLGEGGEIAFINITDISVFGANDVVTWTWNYGDGGDETHDFNGLHTYDTWGEFVVTLSVETDQGCASTVSHTVYIEADLEFPNVMTPNGDGINDVFAIKNMNPILPNRLCIYNRWGKKVYDKENYQAYIKDDQLYNADQGFNAENLSDGVYYYTFQYEGYTRGVDYHGSLTILRDK